MRLRLAALLCITPLLLIFSLPLLAASDLSPPSCSSDETCESSSVSFTLQSRCELDATAADLLESGLMRFGVTKVESLFGVDDFLLEAAVYDYDSHDPNLITKVTACFTAHFGTSAERQASSLHDECALADALMRMGEDEAESGQCERAERLLREAASKSTKCPELAADVDWELHQAMASCRDTATKEEQQQQQQQRRRPSPPPPKPAAVCSEVFPEIHGDHRIMADYEILSNNRASGRDAIHWRAWYDLFKVDAATSCDSAKVGKAWRKLSLRFHPDKQDNTVPRLTECASEAMRVISSGKEALIEASPCAQKKEGFSRRKTKNGRKSPEQEAAEQFAREFEERISWAIEVWETIVWYFNLILDAASISFSLFLRAIEVWIIVKVILFFVGGGDGQNVDSTTRFLLWVKLVAGRVIRYCFYAWCVVASPFVLLFVAFAVFTVYS
jgi:hypothetical protein